ncbi:hypothetical protein CEXT_25031 [Caerostris extrusa]|uniref:Uncharacterized protein n=1 Tax=Caerostris extrusa TaxID=172846 RepID=A0AAV4TLR7_CAEEX|nr:hypothetical protein CEXT_25031 [Caerostris extrusa]
MTPEDPPRKERRLNPTECPINTESCSSPLVSSEKCQVGSLGQTSPIVWANRAFMAPDLSPKRCLMSHRRSSLALTSISFQRSSLARLGMSSSNF